MEIQLGKMQFDLFWIRGIGYKNDEAGASMSPAGSVPVTMDRRNIWEIGCLSLTAESTGWGRGRVASRQLGLMSVVPIVALVM